MLRHSTSLALISLWLGVGAAQAVAQTNPGAAPAAATSDTSKPPATAANSGAPKTAKKAKKKPKPAEVAPADPPAPPATQAAEREAASAAAKGKPAATSGKPAPTANATAKPAPAAPAAAKPAPATGTAVASAGGGKPAPVAPAAAAKPGPKCSLDDPEQPRGGRLDVIGTGFGASPLVRIAGKPVRMIERREDRISVQVPADSNGGPVAVQAQGVVQPCGTLVIIGKNR